jgi:hypothetical protein
MLAGIKIAALLVWEVNPYIFISGKFWLKPYIYKTN